MTETELGEIVEIENVWITMSDGCRIAARIWLPADAEAAPVPAILEYIPYRKRDFMRARDEPIHRYFAQAGYAAVRVDLRGSGDSDGVLFDEYTQQELDDALEIIAWIAAQPWCSGAVGMMGISWGGFNALQVAALDPPALKAIITLCSTDDRYADDAHYMGGCLLNENLQWGAILLTYCAYPPDPQIVGERWRAMWRERLDHLVPFPGALAAAPVARRLLEARLGVRGLRRDQVRGLRHRRLGGRLLQRRAAADARPVLPEEGPDRAVGAPLPAQRRARSRDRLPAGGGALVGPLAEGHRHRHHGRAAAAGLDAGERRPAALPRGAAGALGRRAVVAVGAHREAPLLPQPGPARAARAGRRVALAFSSPQTTGLRAGEWCAFGAEGEMPLDQRPDDGRSLDLRHRAARRRGLEILGRAGRRARPRGRRAERAARGPPERRAARRHLDARSPTGCST